MTQDLTTRDIFQQLDARLTRVEDDLRAFRAEVNVRFDQINSRTDQVDSRLDQINARFDQQQWRVVGLFIITWVTVIGSIWLKP